MKIAFVQKVKAFAGSEKYFLSILPELNKRNINTRLIIVINESDKKNCLHYIELLESAAIDYEIINAKSDKHIFTTLKLLSKAIKNFEPEIVHSHLIHADFWCAVLKKRKKLRQPIVSTKHGYEEAYLAENGFDGTKVPKNTYFRMSKFSEKQITKSYAVSEGLRNLFIGAKICKAKEISTIHHGFDLGDKPITTADRRVSPQQLLIIGRVIPFKGHHLALEAFSQVVKALPGAKCVIVGSVDEIYKAQLDEIIAQKHLINNIHFEGFQSDIYNYMLSSDILLVPSISEGFGLVFLEGFNAEIPIVGFDVAATNEIIQSNVNGKLIPPYDVDLLAKELILLLNNKIDRERLASEGRKTLLDYFNLERMASETIAFYNSVL